MQGNSLSSCSDLTFVNVTILPELLLSNTAVFSCPCSLLRGTGKIHYWNSFQQMICCLIYKVVLTGPFICWLTSLPAVSGFFFLKQWLLCFWFLLISSWRLSHKIKQNTPHTSCSRQHHKLRPTLSVTLSAVVMAYVQVRTSPQCAPGWGYGSTRTGLFLQAPRPAGRKDMGTTWGECLCPSAFALGMFHTLGIGHRCHGDEGDVRKISISWV